jgi:hypothetical protein
MADLKKTPNTHNNSFILLSLGSLVGFLIGFVLLLANLPNYNYSGNQGRVSESGYNEKDSTFEFYSMLPDLKVDMARHENEVYEPKLPVFRSRAEQLKYEPANDITLHEIPASYAAETYFLQAGSFSTQSDAEKMRAKLLLNGLDAFIKPFNKEGRQLHRVRLGPYYSKDDLKKAKNSLQGRGISYMVLRVRG